jgi:hypothetical protein
VAVQNELKSRRVKVDGVRIGTESTAEGVFIVLTKAPAVAA